MVPFVRPTLSELISRTRGDLRGRLEIAGPLVRRAMADVLGTVWGGAVHTLYGYLDWIARQLFAGTAERAELLRRAALFGITPVAASFASGNVTATGENGSPILADTVLRLDAVIAYRVVTGQVIASGTATLPVVALLAGSASNLAATSPLTFESPVDGVNAAAVVATGGISGGVDEESTEEVRDRFKLRLREPPQGGADQDYEAWALAVPGVTRAWVYPHELGLGTVVVRFMTDDPETGEAGFPDGAAVIAVQAALEAQRPNTAEVTAAAATELAVAFTAELDPDNADTRAAVTAELEDLFRREAEPGDASGTRIVPLSKIRTAIGNAEGIEDYTLTVPSADVVPGVGQLPTVGVITWL